MSIQDRNKDTGRPQSRRLGRRAFIDTSLKLATGIAAAPLLLAAEPVFRPFVDRGGLVSAEAGTDVALPHEPYWASRPSPEARTEWIHAHRQFTQFLKAMKGTGYPEFVNIVDSFMSNNGLDSEGKEVQESFEKFSLIPLLRYNAEVDSVQRSTTDSLPVFYGPNSVKKQQLDFELVYVNKLAKNLIKPGNLEGMLSFYRSEIARLDIMQIAREVGQGGGSIEDAVISVKSRLQEVGNNTLAKKNSVRADIVSQGLHLQWGVTAVAEPEQTDASVSTDGKPEESS